MQTYIEEINAIKYKFCVEELLYSQIKPLLSSIEKIPKEELRNGYKIEAGFSLFILLETSEGYIIVKKCELTRESMLLNTFSVLVNVWFQNMKFLLLIKIVRMITLYRNLTPFENNGHGLFYDELDVHIKGHFDKRLEIW